MSTLRPRHYDGPRPPLRLARPLLWLAALASLVAWLAVERHHHGLTHPRFGDMLAAARTMQAGMRVIAGEKARLGLLQPAWVDRNRTGLIGPEYTPITTSLGLLDAKRTAANPDLAAAIVRVLHPLRIAPGEVVVVALSGSLVGANLAVLSALEALDLQAVVVSSVSASMWGATDPDLTWLDMERRLVDAGVLATPSRLAVRGGIGGIGRGLPEAALVALDAAIARHGATAMEADTLAEMTAQVETALLAAAGTQPRLFVNAGGSTLALGTCAESPEIPPGLSTRPLPCTDGVAGLAMRFAGRGVPILHLLDMRRLAVEWGLPFDPYPLPAIGDERRIYGSPPPAGAEHRSGEPGKCCTPA